MLTTVAWQLYKVLLCMLGDQPLHIMPTHSLAYLALHVNCKMILVIQHHGTDIITIMFTHAIITIVTYLFINGT